MTEAFDNPIAEHPRQDRMMAGEAARSYYQRWFDVYRELTSLPIDKSEVRHSPEVVARLRNLGWNTSPTTFDAYWHRVSWISRHCQGAVLEIGCGLGNVTKWIAANADVQQVVALDILTEYIAYLNSMALLKVTAICHNLLTGNEAIIGFRPFQTVVLSEVMEHISVEQEINLVEAVRPCLSPGARWLISTPVGFMADPDHKRGFTPWWFRLYVGLIYGSIGALASNGIQQYALCQSLSFQSVLGWPVRCRLATTLDRLFSIRPRIDAGT